MPQFREASVGGSVAAETICLGDDRLTAVTGAEGELVMTMYRDRGEVQVNGEKVKAGDAPCKRSSQWVKEGERLL